MSHAGARGCATSGRLRADTRPPRGARARAFSAECTGLRLRLRAAVGGALDAPRSSLCVLTGYEDAAHEHGTRARRANEEEEEEEEEEERLSTWLRSD
eukprot:7385423-Prymnesium_polylepis.5